MKLSFPAILLALLFLSAAAAAPARGGPVQGSGGPVINKLFHKEEITQPPSLTGTEALSMSRKIGIDIGKVETAMGSRRGAGDLAAFSESLLLEADKLSRLYQQSGNADGAAHAGLMLKDARRLNQLASGYARSKGSPSARAAGEMKMLLGRLRERVETHDQWLRGSAGTTSPTGLKQRPIQLKQRPATETAPAGQRPAGSTPAAPTWR